MTLIGCLFTTYHPCGSNKKVQTATETALTVGRIGIITLVPIGKLEHVIHVPNSIQDRI